MHLKHFYFILMLVGFLLLCFCSDFKQNEGGLVPSLCRTGMDNTLVGLSIPLHISEAELKHTVGRSSRWAGSRLCILHSTADLFSKLSAFVSSCLSGGSNH